jgi:hypothetical protein
MQLAPEFSPQRVAHRPQLIERACYRVVRRLGIPEGHIERKAAVVERHEYRVRARPIDRRVGRERFLDDLAVVCLYALERNAMTRCCSSQGRHHEMRSGVTDNAEPKRRQRL